VSDEEKETQIDAIPKELPYPVEGMDSRYNVVDRSEPNGSD